MFNLEDIFYIKDPFTVKVTHTFYAFDVEDTSGNKAMCNVVLLCFYAFNVKNVCLMPGILSMLKIHCTLAICTFMLNMCMFVRV